MYLLMICSFVGGTLQGIGILFVIGLSLYLYLNYLDQESLRKRKYRSLFEFSAKCQARKSELEKLSEYNFDKELKKIFNDPKELELAIDNKLEYESIRNTRQEEVEQIFKVNRKIGYTYENAIFEIFGLDKTISIEQLRSRIYSYYVYDEIQCNKLIEIWKKNNLLRIYRGECEVGFILTDKQYKLTDDDLTRDEWIGKNLNNLNNKEIITCECEYENTISFEDYCDQFNLQKSNLEIAQMPEGDFVVIANDNMIFSIDDGLKGKNLQQTIAMVSTVSLEVGVPKAGSKRLPCLLESKHKWETLDLF